MIRGVLAVLVVLAGLWLAGAQAHPVRDMRSRLLSCPDPSVIDARVGHYRYYLVCTSDNNPNAFPIRGSNDLRRWHFVDYVLPAGHQPWWALPSPHGRYWAPAIYRIQGRWVVYFAAQHNPATLHQFIPAVWVLGVAWANSLHGPWRTKLLHYRGQFNAVTHEHESYGGVIDPSMIQDPRTGQRYLFWAEQTTSIWASKLSPDGLTLDPHTHQVMWARHGWESRTSRGRGVIEGPEEYYKDGWFYLFYSGASTWLGTYGVGVAVGRDPTHSRFVRLDAQQPILRSGHGWFGPGGSSAPVTGPDGKTYLLYHVGTGPNRRHISADRFLFVSPVNWTGIAGYYPLVNNGQAG